MNREATPREPESETVDTHQPKGSNAMTNTNSTLTAFVLGAVAGGVTALLFAPMSGERLRERIAERGGELKESTSKNARAAADRARDTVDGARNAAKQKAAAVSEAIEVGKATYKDELEKAKSA